MIRLKGLDMTPYYKMSIVVATWEPQVRDHMSQEFGTKLGKTESFSFCFSCSPRLVKQEVINKFINRIVTEEKY